MSLDLPVFLRARAYARMSNTFNLVFRSDRQIIRRKKRHKLTTDIEHKTVYLRVCSDRFSGQTSDFGQLGSLVDLAVDELISTILSKGAMVGGYLLVVDDVKLWLEERPDATITGEVWVEFSVPPVEAFKVKTYVEESYQQYPMLLAHPDKRRP